MSPPPTLREASYSPSPFPREERGAEKKLRNPYRSEAKAMTTTATTLKDQILEAIDHLPAETLAEILDYVKSRQLSAETVEESAVWQAYQRSKQKRAEVYRRLADS
jgi:hypothetical protein